RVELALRPGVGRVGPDAAVGAVLVEAVAADVEVEPPAEARVRGPAVAPEVGDLPAAPAPANLLVVSEDDQPGEVAARRPGPARPAGASREPVVGGRFRVDVGLDLGVAAVDVCVVARLGRVLGAR